MKTLLATPFIFLLSFCSIAQCTDLFFSEYLEGSSSNKALEIYNPTDVAIDLTDYVLYRNNNGSLSPTDSLFPQGMLAPKDVFVIGNPSANTSIMNVTDTTHTMTFFNGDDAVWLRKRLSLDTLDIIGTIGVDPGSGWTVGSGATNNFTLVRMLSIQQGQKNWTIGATEWDVFPIDMTDSLGMHTMFSCPPLSIVENVSNINKVYPNPTDGKINIQLNQTYALVFLTVRDLNGREVFSDVYKNSDEIELNINGANGIYFLETRTKNKKSMTKIVLK